MASNGPDVGRKGSALVIGSAHGGDEVMNERGILDAFGGFHRRAHINAQGQSPRAQRSQTIAHVCRCESTRQNEVSFDVWRQL